MSSSLYGVYSNVRDTNAAAAALRSPWPPLPGLPSLRADESGDPPFPGVVTRLGVPLVPLADRGRATGMTSRPWKDEGSRWCNATKSGPAKEAHATGSKPQLRGMRMHAGEGKARTEGVRHGLFRQLHRAHDQVVDGELDREGVANLTPQGEPRPACERRERRRGRKWLRRKCPTSSNSFSAG